MAVGLTWNVYDANTMTQAEIYGKVLCRLGEENADIVGLSADLAKSTKIGEFAARFPDRFFNAGVAEQNMFGMAAGLAKAGLIPFVSTMAVFTTMRAGEQVRTDICYQNLNVKIIATHGGISFGQAGTTHQCTEDIAITRAMANMTVIVPADGIECANAVRACMDIHGPVYIRIGRGFEPNCYTIDAYGLEIGKAVEMNPGTDITLICCGITVLQALEAARVLEKSAGISARVQFLARDGEGDVGAYLKFADGRLDVVEGTCPKPDIAFLFASVGRMNAMLGGKPALFRIKGFYRVSLLMKVLALLMNLTLLMPTARPTDPEKKRLKVKLTLYMMAASLSQFNKLGHPDIRKWTSGQPERIYQFSVAGREDMAAYLRVKAGKTQAGPGLYAKRRPFVHMKFRSVDEALPIILNEVNMVMAVEKGYLSLEGSPEYARDIGNFMMQIQSLIM